jgi:hypothetical protein
MAAAVVHQCAIFPGVLRFFGSFRNAIAIVAQPVTTIWQDYRWAVYFTEHVFIDWCRMLQLDGVVWTRLTVAFVAVQRML